MAEEDNPPTLRRSIEAGDDAPIRDFLLAVMRVNSDEQVLAYHDLILRLEMNTPFVVERRSRFVKGFFVFAPREMGDDKVDVRERLYFGRLEDAVRFDVEKGYLVLPTGKFFVRYDGVSWDETQGDVHIDPYDMMHYRMDLTMENPRALRVYTGKELGELVQRVGCPYTKK